MKTWYFCYLKLTHIFLEKRKQIIESDEEDEEDDYEDEYEEDDDFIDDGPVQKVADDYSSVIKNIFGYDKSK